jgi:hypothetical protein
LYRCQKPTEKGEGARPLKHLYQAKKKTKKQKKKKKKQTLVINFKFKLFHAVPSL